MRDRRFDKLIANGNRFAKMLYRAQLNMLMNYFQVVHISPYPFRRWGGMCCRSTPCVRPLFIRTQGVLLQLIHHQLNIASFAHDRE